MASTLLVARPARFRSLGPPPAAPARKAPPRRPLIYWPAVALAASAGALCVAGVTLSVALLAPRTPKVGHVALAKPPAGEPGASIPAAARPAPEVLAVSLIPPPAPDPVPPPTQTCDAARDDPPAPAPTRRLDPPAVEPLLQLAAPPLAPTAPVCQTFGTSVAFAVSPAAAEKQAAQDGKLVFLLHVSGDFEDDAFT